VCVGRSFSKIVRFALGVPQGSISGPLLFALYLSTLTEEIRTAVTSELRTVEYADDVNMWLRLRRNADNSYDTTQAQTALNVISTWSENYGINVSISDSIKDTKTYGFIYTANHLVPALPVNLTYRGIPLAIKNEAKMLGVTFDHCLNFETHIKKVTSAAKLKLSCISKIIGKAAPLHGVAGLSLQTPSVRPSVSFRFFITFRSGINKDYGEGHFGASSLVHPLSSEK
jgi:hypothetical protein